MKFYLENDGELKYMNSSTEVKVDLVIGENVFIYDYIINKDNTILLVYLQSDGSLIYKTINGENSTEVLISKFDIKSNIYNQITILNIDGSLNILYSFYNIMNFKVHTIHHVIFEDNSIKKYNVIKYVSKNNDDSFVVDYDSKKNIHLFYNNVSQNHSHIYYTYFNPYKNQWLNAPMKLSNSDSFTKSPSIFVDSMNNIHGVWWERDINVYVLMYKRMSTTGADMYKWKTSPLPSVVEEEPQAKIYEIDSTIYIESFDSIMESKDYGLKWVKREKNIDDIIRNKESEPIVINKGEENENSIKKAETDMSQPQENIYTDETYKLKLDVLLLDQKEILNSIKDILYKQELLESKISKLEDSLEKQSKGGFKNLFFN